MHGLAWSGGRGPRLPNTPLHVSPKVKLSPRQQNDAQIRFSVRNQRLWAAVGLRPLRRNSGRPGGQATRLPGCQAAGQERCAPFQRIARDDQNQIPTRLASPSVHRKRLAVSRPPQTARSDRSRPNHSHDPVAVDVATQLRAAPGKQVGSTTFNGPLNVSYRGVKGPAVSGGGREARGNCTCNFPLTVPARRGWSWSTVLGLLAWASPCEAVLCTAGASFFPHTHAPTHPLDRGPWTRAVDVLPLVLFNFVCVSLAPSCHRPLVPPPPSRQTPRSFLYPHRILLTSRAVSRSLHHPRTSLAKSILYPVVRNQCLTYIVYHRPRARARSHAHTLTRTLTLTLTFDTRPPSALIYKVRPVNHSLAPFHLAVRSFVFRKIESAIAGRHRRPRYSWDNRQLFSYIHLDGITFSWTIETRP